MTTTVETPRIVGATVTADGPLPAGHHTPVNASAGARTMTLPTAVTPGAHLSVEKTDTSTNPVVITGTIRGATSSISLVLQYESVTFRADSSGNSWWPTAGHKTKASLDGLYAQTLSLVGSSLTISGPAGNSVTIPTSGGATVTDATTAAKGIVQLAGDLAGTAAAPTVPALAGKAPLASPTFTGTVSGITAAMVGADAAGAATAAQAASLQKTSNLSDLANAATARTNLGLGTAATSATTAFDAAGAAAAVTPTSLGIGNAVTLGGTVNAITTNATAVIGVRNTVNAASGAITVTLPTPTRVGQSLIIERLDTSATNAITVTGTIRGVGATTAVLPAAGVAGEGALWVAESLTSWVPAGSIKPKAWLDALYAPKPTGTPAAGTYVDGGTGAWTTLPSGGGSAIEGLAAMKPPIGGAVFTSASGTSGQAPAIGTLDLGLLYVPGGTYNTAVCRVNSPIAGATVKMVAYKHDPTNILGTLLFDTTAVAATSGGYLAITLPTALVVADPGYPIWFGLVNQGSAAANFWYGTAGIGLPYLVSAGGSVDLNNTTPPTVQITGVTGAAPTSPTGVTIAPHVGAPRVALTRSA